MRARTRRFRSFSRGIVSSPLNAPRLTPQQRRDDAKDRCTESGSVPPFASLEDSGWGGVVRGWAWTNASQTLAQIQEFVKLPAARLMTDHRRPTTNDSRLTTAQT